MWKVVSSSSLHELQTGFSLKMPIACRCFLRPGEVRKICYSLAELSVKSIHFNLFGWRARELHETFRGGGRKCWNLWVTHCSESAALNP
jgi:hypothetical protein